MFSPMPSNEPERSTTRRLTFPESMVSSGMNATANARRAFEILADAALARKDIPLGRRLALVFSAWTMFGLGSVKGLRARQNLALAARGIA